MGGTAGGTAEAKSPAVAVVDFTTYPDSVSRALDTVGAAEALAAQRAVMIKPNLINASPHPVTTPADCCEALIRYIRACSDAEIVVAEGCGDPGMETDEVFERLGYRSLAERTGISLIDLNHAPLVRLADAECRVFPEIHLPEIAMNSFLISVPVLKAHSLAQLTGSLKNMIGLAPPEHYSGQGGTWKKAMFHREMQRSILELNRHRSPDLSLMDASVGLAEFHLGGPPCSPPVAKMIASFDPLSLDRVAAELLGLDWRSIPHLGTRL